MTKGEVGEEKELGVYSSHKGQYDQLKSHEKIQKKKQQSNRLLEL